MSWQTIDEFAALIQPLLGRSCWWLYCDLGNRELADLAQLSAKDKLALEHCDPSFCYGDLMVELDGRDDTKDITFTHDLRRDGIGGPPLWALRVVDKSIPALWADKLDTFRDDRKSAHCQLFPLGWRMLSGISHHDSFILTAAWAVPDEVHGLYGSKPCMSAVVLQFDYTCQTQSLPASELPDWLKPGLLERMSDKLDRAVNVKLAQRFDRSLARLRERVGERETGMARFITKGVKFIMPVGGEEIKTPPRTGTMFLGLTFPVDGEDAEIGYFFQDHLPDGLDWKRVVGITEQELGQKEANE